MINQTLKSRKYHNCKNKTKQSLLVKQTIFNSIKKLQLQNNNLKQTIQSLKKQKQKTTKQINQNRSKDEQIRKQIFIQIQKLQKSLQNKQKQVFELRKQPREQHIILNHIKSRQNDLQQKINRLEIILRQQKYKAEKTIESLQRLNVESQMDISKYQREVNMLITELEQNKEKCLKLEFNNNSLDQEMKRTLRLFDEYRGKKQDIQQKYNALKDRMQQIQIHNNTHNNNMKQKGHKRDISNIDQKGLISKVQDLRRQNSNLKGLLNNASININAHSTASKNLSDLQARVLKFQQRTNWLLNNQQKSSPIQNSKILDLRQRVKSLKKQNQSLKFQVSNLINKHNHTSSDKQIQTNKTPQISNIFQQSQPFNKLVADQYEKRISVYVSEIERQNYLCNEYQGRIKQYQNSLLKIKNKYDKQDNTFFKNKNIELENRVEQLLSINTELKQQLQHTQDNSKDLYRHQINILQDRLLTVQQKLDQSVKENIKLQEHITLLQVNNNRSPPSQTQKHQKQIKKLSDLLEQSAYHIQQLQNTIQSLKQIIISHEHQNQKLLQQNHQLSEQIHTSIESDMSQSYKYLEIEFEKLNEIIQCLKSEGIKIIDIVSGVVNGGEIVEKVMERINVVEGIRNSFVMIRTHMESLQKHQRYSYVIN